MTGRKERIRVLHGNTCAKRKSLTKYYRLEAITATNVTSKGQVIIPIEFRKALGIKDAIQSILNLIATGSNWCQSDIESSLGLRTAMGCLNIPEKW